MTTLRQAIESLRENGTLPPSDTVSIRALHQKFKPTPSNSVRALLSLIFGSVSKRFPWAVILCRFKGSTPDPVLEAPIEKFYREIFAPGTGGLVEYWRDVSLGKIDISGSRVFGWIEVEIKRSEAGGTPNSMPSGPGRKRLVNYAINAIKQQEGEDALNGFLGPIAIYTHNWSIDNVPPGTTWKTPGFFQFWIDGSAEGNLVCLTPPHNGNITAHEMGHVFGMNHDVDSDLQTDYRDPCCIMSQNGPFIHPTWQRNFGPAVCLPHLMQRDWMYKHRVFFDDGNWMSQPDGITLQLAPISRPGSRANLGVKLAYKRDEANWDVSL